MEMLKDSLFWKSAHLVVLLLLDEGCHVAVSPPVDQPARQVVLADTKGKQRMCAARILAAT